MDKPAYYSIIPASVRYDKSICANAKLMYGEITALCNQEGYCWASNAYFTELYNVSEVSVSKWINSLAKAEFLTIEISQEQGNKRLIYLCEVINKSLRGHKEKLKTPHKEKFIHNNKAINNKINTDAALISQFKEETNAGEVAIKLMAWFIAYRKRIKKPIKTIAPMKLLITEMRKCINSGYKIEAMQELMEAKEWQSIKLEWVQKELPKEKEWEAK